MCGPCSTVKPTCSSAAPSFEGLGSIPSDPHSSKAVSLFPQFYSSGRMDHLRDFPRQGTLLALAQVALPRLDCLGYDAVPCQGHPSTGETDSFLLYLDTVPNSTRAFSEKSRACIVRRNVESFT